MFSIKRVIERVLASVSYERRGSNEQLQMLVVLSVMHREFHCSDALGLICFNETQKLLSSRGFFF